MSLSGNRKNEEGGENLGLPSNITSEYVREQGTWVKVGWEGGVVGEDGAPEVIWNLLSNR